MMKDKEMLKELILTNFVLAFDVTSFFRCLMEKIQQDIC